jgi:uncharacterized protein YgiM (DUF1202 family)
MTWTVTTVVIVLRYEPMGLFESYCCYAAVLIFMVFATQEIQCKTSEAHRKKNKKTLKPKNSVDNGGKVGANLLSGVVIPD